MPYREPDKPVPDPPEPDPLSGEDMLNLLVADLHKSARDSFFHATSLEVYISQWAYDRIVSELRVMAHRLAGPGLKPGVPLRVHTMFGTCRLHVTDGLPRREVRAISWHGTTGTAVRFELGESRETSP